MRFVLLFRILAVQEFLRSRRRFDHDQATPQGWRLSQLGLVEDMAVEPDVRGQ